MSRPILKRLPMVVLMSGLVTAADAGPTGKAQKEDATTRAAFKVEAERDIAEMNAKLERLIASYVRLEVVALQATMQAKEMAAAQKDLADTTLKTDELVAMSRSKNAEQDKAIRQQFAEKRMKAKTDEAANDIINSRLAANVEKDRAQKKMEDIDRLRHPLEVEEQRAQEAFDRAKGFVTSEKVQEAIAVGGDRLRLVIEGQQAAFVAQEILKAAHDKRVAFDMELAELTRVSRIAKPRY